MVNRKTLAIAGYISLVLVSICLGRMTVPTVGRVVEKPVEVIKYLPAPVLQQATTPFGMTGNDTQSIKDQALAKLTETERRALGIE